MIAYMDGDQAVIQRIRAICHSEANNSKPALLDIRSKHVLFADAQLENQWLFSAFGSC